MLIYLDNSFLNRPFDDPDAGTNKLEADILSLVIKLVNKNKVDLINSSVIEYENSLNLNPDRKLFVETVLKQSDIYQNINEDIKKQAENLVTTMNISPIDALHLATAEAAKVDVFITCDYDIIKRYRGETKAISPLDFIQHYERSNK